jgi:hypothetical protein
MERSGKQTPVINNSNDDDKILITGKETNVKI